MDLQGTNSRRGCPGLCANMLTTNIGSEKESQAVAVTVYCERASV